MTVYGLTPQGFNRKTQENITDEIRADQSTNIGDDFDNSTPSIPGQMNGIFARQLGMGWEQLEVLYNGMDPDASQGRLLEFLSKLTGTKRQGSTPSIVTLTCGLDAGTVLVPGTHFAAIKDSPDVRFTPSLSAYPTGYTAASGGPQPVIFECELLGPTQAPAGTISVIATPVVGWKTVVNPDDAELGLQPDADPALRLRRVTEIATIGSATLPSVRANVAQAFGSKIQTLQVFENENDNPNSDGLPGHSLEVLIFDGDVPAVDNDALANVIFRAKAGGVNAVGNSSGNASVVVNGVTVIKPIGFSRAAQLGIYLDIQIVKNGAPYVGDAALALAIATASNAFFGPGDEVVSERIKAFALAQSGIKDVPVIKLGLLPNPTGLINLPMTIREAPRFSTSRIVIRNAV